MNENLNVNAKNGNKGNLVVTIILTILLLGLAGFICYDKIIKKDDEKECTCEKTECNCEKCDNSEKETCDCTKESNDNIKEDTDTNSVKTRICTGTYTGTGAVRMNAFTKELTNGTIKVTLRSDGTYALAKDDTEWASGNYIIIENVLLLKTVDDICGPGMDCSAKYGEFLFIENDCSQITGGYGSFFFDSNFTLKK